jgi:PqqD family protein of HPr-rel-A system
MTAPLKPKTRDDLTFVDVDDDALVYDPRNHDVHHLNPTGKLVFQLCDGTSSLEETATAIADAFGADPDAVERDVRGAARELRKLGLLEDGQAAAGATEAAATGEPEEIPLEVLSSG